MNVYYQKLLPEHTPQYRAIRLESLKRHPEHFGSKYEEQIELSEMRLESAIKRQESDRFVMGAFIEEQLIGICAFIAHNDFGLNQTGTLIQMYVRVNFAGNKIGLGLTKALLEEALERPDITQVILEVNPKNAKAIRVYKQSGFEVFTPETATPAQLEESKFMMFEDEHLP